ncbi:MAG: hypothetical protein HUU55_09605 [Myxococcales bacterium]|nr:hypothetical protein [Myxococcales bacterium]
MGTKIYIGTLAILFVFLLGHTVIGIDPFTTSEKGKLTAEQRATPGGYRSHAIWRHGYFGGK